jgi:HEAT repeat protein
MDEAIQQLLVAIEAGDDARAERAAQELGRWGGAAVPALQGLRASADPDERWWAVRALAAVGAPAVAELVAALEDPDPDVRACAVVGLAELGPAAAVSGLMARLADPSAYVARLAADALGRCGQPAVQPLIVALGSGDPATRVGAARALSVLQAPEAIPALFSALDDPSAAVAYYAEEALERMGVGLIFFRP